MSVGESNTIDQNIRQLHKGGLLKSTVSRMSGPPPETTQDSIQTKTQTSPMIEIRDKNKVSGPARLGDKYSSDHAKATDLPPGDVSEEPVTQEKRNKGWRMSCDVGEATEGLENEL